jgi:hypothetical protein
MIAALAVNLGLAAYKETEFGKYDVCMGTKETVLDLFSRVRLDTL